MGDAGMVILCIFASVGLCVSMLLIIEAIVTLKKKWDERDANSYVMVMTDQRTWHQIQKDEFNSIMKQQHMMEGSPALLDDMLDTYNKSASFRAELDTFGPD